MREISDAFQATLDGGATTLCWCWTISRSDGVVLGLTEHDKDLVVDGVTHWAGTGAVTGAADASLGFGADAGGLAGVLNTARISQADLLAGRYSDAVVDVKRVDWSDPTNVIQIWRGRVGEVTQGEVGFTMELRGITADLERQLGRVIQRRCDAQLGDGRCGVDLTSASYAGAGAITSVVDDYTFQVSGLAEYADAWFTDGVLTWSDGASAGISAHVAAHQVSGDSVYLRLALAPTTAPSAGDAFAVSAGCDKRWITCQSKFANVPNFRGFPMVPGDDWLVAGPTDGQAHDGSSLWTDRDG